MGVFDLLSNLSGTFGISKEDSGVNAGENETAVMMSLQEHLVKPDRFHPGYLGPFGSDEFQKFLKYGTGVLSERGVPGDPTGLLFPRGASSPGVFEVLFWVCEEHI